MDRLGQLGRSPTGPELAVGSTAVARQLHEVTSNWSKARAVLAEQLAALATAADACARSYAGVEGELADAIGAAGSGSATARRLAAAGGQRPGAG